MAFTRNPSLGFMQMNTFATGAPRYNANQGTIATAGQLSSDGYEERRRKMMERRRALENRIRQMRGGGTVDPSQGGFQS